MKNIEVKACVAVDTSCYQTVFLQVDKSLLQDTEKLSAYTVGLVQKLYDDDELTEFEPDHETQANFRLVCITQEVGDRGGSEHTLVTDVPIESNYHDFGLEVSGRLRRDADAPEWVIDLAHHYKLID